MASASESTSVRRGSRAKRPTQRFEPAEHAPKPVEKRPRRATAKSSRAKHRAEDDVEDDEAESDDEVYCICRKSNDGSPMICCSTCGEWYHFRCIGLTKRAAEDLDEYVCQACTEKEAKEEQRVQQKQADQEDEYKEEEHDNDDDDDDDDVDDDEEPADAEDAVDAADADDASESDSEPARKRARASTRSARPAARPSRPAARASGGAVVKDPVRAHVLKTFTEILAGLFAADGGADAEERATSYSEKLEQELHAALGQREKGRLYKERFRTLAFNLKDTHNTSLHMRITSGALTPAALAHLPNEELANDAIREATEKAKRDALQQSVLREQGDGPARKITHKGEVDIERDDAAPYVAPDPRPEMVEPAPKPEEPTPEPAPAPAAVPAPAEPSPSPGPARPAVNFAEAWKTAESADPPSPGFTYAVGGESPPHDEQPFLSESHDVDSALDTFLDAPAGADASAAGPAEPAPSTTPPGTPPQDSPAGRRLRSGALHTNPVVWDGVITMPEYTSAYVHARQLSQPAYAPTSSLWPALFAGAECMVEGRLPSQTAIDYLHQVRHSPRNDILLLALDAGGAAPAPERPHEASPMLYSSPSLEKLVRYFADKHRFGVLAPAPGMMGSLVKDFYIAPLRSDEPVPEWLYTLHPDGLGDAWAEQRPAHILIAVVVLFRAALEARVADDAAPEPEAPAPAPAPADAAPPGAAPAPVSLDTLLNVKPDAIQNLLSTLGSSTPPSAPGAPPVRPMPPGAPPLPGAPLPRPPLGPPGPLAGPGGPGPLPPPGAPGPRPMRQWGTGANATPTGWQAPGVAPPYPYPAPMPPMPGWTPSRGGWYGGNPEQTEGRRSGRSGRRSRR
ncbi:Transcription factor bye1 [Malassezia obtusa]|uniref:Transcription factor BYE1 n=1 Tax=Malassezia obtusa TaxID=76774 RepID=A0AAF0IT55_9BASI|nr:Transcription factor bye1 [Malassezia obtusa]